MRWCLQYLSMCRGEQRSLPYMPEPGCFQRHSGCSRCLHRENIYAIYSLVPKYVE